MFNFATLLNAGSDFTTLFADSGIVAGICIFIGLVFFAIECFVPGFGFFGISGGVLVVFGIVYRMVMGGTWWHFFYMCVIVIIVVALLILIAIRSARFGFLSKTALVDTTTALPTDYADNDKNYGYLLNKTGTTITVCKPVGKIDIEGKTYQAISNGDYLEKDSKIVVTEVDGSTIVIKKLEEEK